MNTELELWINQASRRLSTDSAARVRTEIREHYESARESAIGNGASSAEADRTAMAALGDAKAVNCEYLRVLLTREEAKLLSQGNWEARLFCSHRWLKWSLLAVPIAALLASAVFFFTGESERARDLLAGGIGMAVWVAAPFLRLYTPMRARIFRVVKWVVLLATFGLVLKSSWMLSICLWPLAGIEWTRFSIRRKLPVAEWSKQLYL